MPNPQKLVVGVAYNCTESAQDDTNRRNLKGQVGANVSPKFFILNNSFFY